MGVLFTGVLPGWAQHHEGDAALSAPPYTFDLRGAWLAEALQQVIAEARIDVAYASVLVAGKKTTCAVIEADVEAVLRCILDGQGLVFQRLTSGAYVIKQAAPTVFSAGNGTPAEPGPPDSANRGARGDISGVVLEQQTGLPLAGASVVVVGTRLGAASGPAGRFTISNVPAGTYAVEASMVGYETQRVEAVTIGSSASAALRFALAEAPVTLREVVVMPGHFSLMHRQPTVQQTLTRKEIRNLPTLGDDVYHALQRLPGLSGNDLSARFTVRGGGHEEVLVRLDGMELIEPFHLKDIPGGGLFSIVDAEAVAGIEMMTGAFSVDYGNRLSGVFDIQSAPTRLDPIRTSLGLSISNVRFLSEGHFSEGRGQWLLVARRGYLDLVLTAAGEDEDIDPTYYDVLGKIQVGLGDKHTLSAHVLAAEDKLDYTATDDEDAVNSRFGNLYGWITLTSIFSPKLLAQTLVSAGRVTQDRAGNVLLYGTLPFFVEDERGFRFYGAKQDWTYEAADRLLLKGGFSVKQLHADYDYANRAEGLDPFRATFTPSGAESGAYLGSRVRLLDPLTVEGGLRFDQASWTDDHTWSPRLNAAYALRPRTVLRLGWGRFYQTQNLYELAVPNRDLVFYEAERAEHRVVSLEHAFRRGLNLRLEAYDKKLSNTRPRYLNLGAGGTELFPEVEYDRVRIEAERGAARGVEVMLRKEAGGPFTWWASYGLALAEDKVRAFSPASNFRGRLTEEALEGTTLPRSIDQRHTFFANVNYRPNEKWSVNLAWQFHSGWPYTEVSYERATTPEGASFFRRLYGPISAERFPPYHRLDLRVSRTFSFSRSRLSFFLDIRNLYNRTNVWYFGQNLVVRPNGAFTVAQEANAWLPFLPTFGASWDLFH